MVVKGNISARLIQYTYLLLTLRFFSDMLLLDFIEVFTLVIKQPPWDDGERIPSERIRDIFRQPPGLPTKFTRCALIVGSRGSGKTTLFKYHRETHLEIGIAADISLLPVVDCLSKQIAIGPFTFDFSSNQINLIINKTISLLSIHIIDHLFGKSIDLPLDLLIPCIPVDIVEVPPLISIEWINSAKTAIARAPLEAFSNLSTYRPLLQLVSALGDVSESTKGPLLLMFDRAEILSAASLIPLIELLDQVNPTLCLVALRPGPSAQIIRDQAESIIPGDHYDVFQLGLHPRSIEWIKFVESALHAQLGDSYFELPEDIRFLVLAVTRDSLRSQLKLFGPICNVKHKYNRDSISSLIMNMKRLHLDRAESILQKYHPNFKEMIRKINREILRKSNITGPVVLTIDVAPPEELFWASNRLARFVDIALRTDSLLMPEGQIWLTGYRPLKVEIPPLFFWAKDRPFWSHLNYVTVPIRKKETKLIDVQSGAPRKPSIFIAYRMRVNESIDFYDNLKSAVKAYPELSNYDVVNGQVPQGLYWPEEIRKRIKNARVVIGDVTGTRSDVLFELGFAYGLSKITIPVVSHPDQKDHLPHWLKVSQLGFYHNHSSISTLITNISVRVTDPQYSKRPQKIIGVPARCVWVREMHFSETARKQAEYVVEQEPLFWDIIRNDEINEYSFHRIANAGLLIVNLNGEIDDAFIHYICGISISNEKIGRGRSLNKLILVLEDPSQLRRSLIAESLEHCYKTVKIIEASQIRVNILNYVAKHEKWIEAVNKKRTII